MASDEILIICSVLIICCILLNIRSIFTIFILIILTCSGFLWIGICFLIDYAEEKLGRRGRGRK